MKNLIVVIALFFSAFSLIAQQKAETIKLNKLMAMIDAPAEKIKVINFWATWCAPCVKELPLFEKLNRERTDVHVTLVSMDLDLDPNPEKVYKFITRKGITSEVVLLDAPDPNSWIEKISKEWSGALPATLIINPQTGQRKFIEKQLHEGDLEQLIAGLQ